APLALFLVLGVAHQSNVIAVADGEIAGSGENVACAFAVAARRFLREVAFQAAQPLLALRFAVLGDVGGEQRRVVGVLTRADADLAAPPGIGEALVGQGLVGHAILGGIHDARAQRQRT